MDCDDIRGISEVRLFWQDTLFQSIPTVSLSNSIAHLNLQENLQTAYNASSFKYCTCACLNL